MELKLLKLNELRLKHLLAIQEMPVDKLDAYDKLVLVHKLTDVAFDDLKRVSLKDIDKIINHYFELFISIKKDVQKNIEVNGKKFTLISQVSEQPLSWHIDSSHFDLSDKAVMAAFCYIEKGMEYCEQDKHENVLNPLQPRIDLFREHLPAEIFVQLDFFLFKKSSSYIAAFTEIQNVRKEKEKKLELKSGNGKKALI